MTDSEVITDLSILQYVIKNSKTIDIDDSLMDKVLQFIIDDDGKLKPGYTIKDSRFVLETEDRTYHLYIRDIKSRNINSRNICHCRGRNSNIIDNMTIDINENKNINDIIDALSVNFNIIKIQKVKYRVKYNGRTFVDYSGYRNAVLNNDSMRSYFKGFKFKEVNEINLTGDGDIEIGCIFADKIDRCNIENMDQDMFSIINVNYLTIKNSRIDTISINCVKNICLENVEFKEIINGSDVVVSEYIPRLNFTCFRMDSIEFIRPKQREIFVAMVDKVFCSKYMNRITYYKVNELTTESMTSDIEEINKYKEAFKATLLKYID